MAEDHGSSVKNDKQYSPLGRGAGRVGLDAAGLTDGELEAWARERAFARYDAEVLVTRSSGWWVASVMLFCDESPRVHPRGYPLLSVKASCRRDSVIGLLEADSQV